MKQVENSFFGDKMENEKKASKNLDRCGTGLGSGSKE